MPTRGRRSSEKLADVLAYQGQKTDETAEEVVSLQEGLPAYERQLVARGITVKEQDDSEELEEKSIVEAPSWEECVSVARRETGTGHVLDELFTAEELRKLDEKLRCLRDEYDAVHRLDATDLAISVSAGIISSAASVLLVGTPEKTSAGLRGKPLENYIRDWFSRMLPPEEMERLARDTASKVPYDAPYNTGFTKQYVEGLWPTMHRLYSLGHDPLLGLVVGTLDIARGRMTTIDKLGRIVSQEIPRYADRRGESIFTAFAKQIVHLTSDVNTSMGLPAPFMGLFNLIQFGSIGEEDQTIAEIVQGMYYEGYDFQHFCSQTITAMLAEAVVRLGYYLKRVKEGHPLADSIPVTANREKRPKLGTMLFIAHSIATAANAGRIAFTKSPMEIDYPQWLFFTYRFFFQAKWVLMDKPARRHEYVMQALESEVVTATLQETESVIILGGEKPEVIER